jgi:sec-independent protein translocase protein TatB
VFNLQGSEIIVILLIALVVLGPERLPDAIRRFMQTYNELRKMGSGFQSEIKSAFDEPMKEMRDTAKLVRDSVDPAAFMAEAEAEQRLRDEAAAARAAVPAESNGAAPPAFPAPGDAPVAAPPPPVASPPPPPPPPPPPGAPVRRLREATTDGTRAAS